jgi:hypothetical protein
MLETLIAALAAPARARLRRFGISALLAGVATALAMIAALALAAALFFWLQTLIGSIRAALTVGAGALALAAAVSGPLWWPRRAPPPPPEPTLAQFVALLARNAPHLSTRQMALGAVLGAVALGLMGAARADEEG